MAIRKRKTQKQKALEFSKRVVLWAVCFTTICVCASYTLSMFDHDPAVDVTVAVIANCLAVISGYLLKSFGEHNSLNKYGITLDEKTQGADEEVAGNG